MAAFKYVRRCADIWQREVLKMFDTSSIILIVSGLVVALLQYLLAQKDAKQAAEIAKLFELHDRDVIELQNLRLHIAGKHYEAQTVDAKFDKLENAFNQGFKNLGDKFDHLSETLLEKLAEAR